MNVLTTAFKMAILTLMFAGPVIVGFDILITALVDVIKKKKKKMKEKKEK